MPNLVEALKAAVVAGQSGKGNLDLGALLPILVVPQVAPLVLLPGEPPARLLRRPATLVAATTDYADVIKRRVVGRAAARERAMFEEHGLRGVVRVFLADARPLERPFRTVDRA